MKASPVNQGATTPLTVGNVSQQIAASVEVPGASDVGTGNCQAAVRLEVDQLFVYLRQEMRVADPAGTFLGLLPRLLVAVRERTGARIVLRQAFADFTRLPSSLQDELYSLGIDAVHVPCRPGKSTVDMAINTEATAAVYTRADINAEVLGGGDADYTPLVRHLKGAGREVWLVAFGPTISTQLRKAVGVDRIIDVSEYLPGSTGTGDADALKAAPSSRPPAESLDTADEVLQVSRELLCVVIEEYVLGHRYSQVWLTKLRQRFLQDHPDITSAVFREAVDLLAVEGAVATRRCPAREGDGRDFAVLVPNPNHELVQAITGGATWPTPDETPSGRAA